MLSKTAESRPEGLLRKFSKFLSIFRRSSSEEKKNTTEHSFTLASLSKPKILNELSKNTGVDYWKTIFRDRIENSVDDGNRDLLREHREKMYKLTINEMGYAANISAQFSSNIDPFFIAYHTAYHNHSGLIISPDDIWTMVLLSFSTYVEENAEKLRNTFVSHQDKKELYFEHPTFDLELFTNSMISQINDNIKTGDLTEKMENNFSTSGIVERMVSKTAVMSTLKPYFSYSCEISCGITHVKLLGTLSDYEKLVDKITYLRKFDVNNSGWNKYIDGVQTIAENLLMSYKGKVNKKWWSKIMDQKYSFGYGSGESELTGWITDLYYNQKFRTPDDIDTQFFDVDVTSQTMGNFKMLAGFSGIYYDSESDSYRPQMSYAVLQDNTEREVNEMETPVFPKRSRKNRGL